MDTDSDSSSAIRSPSLPKSAQVHAKPMPNPRKGAIRFSHPAEEAFAKVLDFYEIKWEYEPTTFPLEWNKEGRVINAFSPDFYLVEEDLYIELTTMQQRLVTRKNRKLRLLHKLYPGVQCKLMYRRDVESLAIKYGLFEADLSAEGSGTAMCLDDISEETNDVSAEVE